MKTPLMTNIQTGERFYPDREVLGVLQKSHGEADQISNEKTAQVAGSERALLAKNRAELLSIIDGEQATSSFDKIAPLNPALELPKPSGFNPVFKLYSTLSELQIGMEGMLADEKNPGIRFGIKIALKLNQFSLFLLADTLGLRDKRGREMEEEKEEKRKKLALLKGMQINSNASKRLIQFGILDFLNIFKNGPDYRTPNHKELAI